MPGGKLSKQRQRLDRAIAYKASLQYVSNPFPEETRLHRYFVQIRAKHWVHFPTGAIQMDTHPTTETANPTRTRIVNTSGIGLKGTGREKIRDIRIYEDNGAIQFWVEIGDMEYLQYISPIDARLIAQTLERLAEKVEQATSETTSIEKLVNTVKALQEKVELLESSFNSLARKQVNIC